MDWAVALKPKLRSHYGDACSPIVNIVEFGFFISVLHMFFLYEGKGRTDWNSDGKNGLPCLFPSAFNTAEELKTARSVQSTTSILMISQVLAVKDMYPWLSSICAILQKAMSMLLGFPGASSDSSIFCLDSSDTSSYYRFYPVYGLQSAYSSSAHHSSWLQHGYRKKD